jgi:phosphopantetheine binding protein
MIRAYTRLKKALNCDISLAEMFFQYPTIQALAEFLSQTQAGIENLEERTEPRGP